MQEGFGEFPREIKVLDKGFVRLVDYMGSDQLIVQAARVSYNFKGKSKDEALIDYLMRNEHMSPFEMVEFVFHLKVPIFVARQIFRHRTASFNEISGRYVKLEDEFYIPNEFRTNSKANKQSSIEENNTEKLLKTMKIFDETYKYVYKNYQEMLDEGLAREVARSLLPLGTYTMFFFKQDLRNLMNFLRLRLDDHTQKETREVARAIASFVAKIVPITWRAFLKHQLNVVKLSEDDVKHIDFTNLTIVNKEDLSATKLEELEGKVKRLRRLKGLDI